MNNQKTKTNLILLHGWGGSKSSLQPLANELTKLGYSTYNLELPGHGQTPQMSSEWTMRDFAFWLNHTIEELKLNDYILVGHSFGGKIIVESILANLVAPQQIILINISGIQPKKNLKTTFWKFVAKKSTFIKNLKFLYPIKRFLYKYILRETDYLNTENQQNLRKTLINILNENYDQKVKDLLLPTLLIWGEQDTYTPLWMGQFLHKEIKNSKLIVHPGTHGLPLKRPELIAKDIYNFLKSN